MSPKRRKQYFVNFHTFMNMVFTLVITVLYAIFETIGLLGNLLVITTISLDSRFHVMRYVALASLAVSDFLYLILVPSFRIASMVQGRWPFGEVLCYLNPNFARYFYFNTILHLIVVSYDRYRAIVKLPLTYDGTISTAKKVSMVINWIVPIPFFITPFLRGRKFHYNPLVFYCEVGLWSSPSTSENTSDGEKATIFTIFLIVLPLLIIAFLNWSVYKTAKTHINAVRIQVESVSGLDESQQRLQHEMIQRKAERRAAADVNIIVVSFFLCFLPPWICGLLRNFAGSVKVPAEATLITDGCFMVSAFCNPLIYSIRKRDFRASVKNLCRRLIWRWQKLNWCKQLKIEREVSLLRQYFKRCFRLIKKQGHPKTAFPKLL